MKRIVLIFICLCFTYFLQAQVKMIVKQASYPPVVDGYLDDTEDPWGILIPLSVRNPQGTTTGMTASFDILNSKDAIYVAIKVEDSTPSNDATAIPNSYERDCSEIFFAMDTVTGATGAYVTGCWQVRIQREGDVLVDGNSGANTWSVAILTSDPAFRAASQSSATEWIGELVFPKSVLSAGMDPAWNGFSFRFDIAVADNTTGSAGGRTEQRYWYGHDGLGDDGEWNNTKSMAIISSGACCEGSSNLTVSTTSVSLGASEGSNSTVNILSNVAWTATSDQTWLTVSPATGTGNATLTLTAKANPAIETRKATITISAPGVSSQTIGVTQAAGTVDVISEMEANLRIYPNPVTDGFIVSGLKESATICVTDLNGRLLLTKQISGNEKIPVHSLSPGLYFVKVITDAGTIKKKLVKQ